MSGFTREGPDDTEIRIIGVELAVRDLGRNEHELQMFECSHTFPVSPYNYDNVRVTLHTSHGDLTLIGTLR